MKENIYHRYLNLPFTYPKPERFNHPSDSYAIVMEEKDIYEPFKLWVEGFGLTISNILEAFYTKPNGSDVPLHVDSGWLPGTRDIGKINFTWGPIDSTTRWYNIKDESKYKRVPLGNRYLNQKFYERGIVPDIDIDYSVVADWKDVEVVHEAVINKPSLMNVGQLHSTWNNSTTEHRWTLCFILKENNETITFQRSLEIFKDYIEE
jgi:hypothetical protein